IRKVHVAAKDKYCGALHYINYDPWMKSKNMEVYLEEGELGAVQLVQQGYHELRRYDGEMSTVLEQFQLDCPRAVEIAFILYRERYLDKCVDNNTSYCDIYDHICDLLGSEET
ncbi:MAG: hypothetical protein K2H12_12365, partial [Acetatifactor sp.]|nr:hypothetical protein [Acetatifactor sp.]